MKAFLLKNNFICCSYLYFATLVDSIYKIKAVREFNLLGEINSRTMNSFSLVASIKFGS